MPALNINPDIAYLKTPQAILKIVQIVTLLIAFSCITDCCDGGKPAAFPLNWLVILGLAYPQRKHTPSDYLSYIRNTSFFLAVTIFGWLLVVFLFVFFIFKLQERFKQIKWDMVVMIISIVWSVLLLLCCSLMGSISSTAFIARSKVTISSEQSTFLKGYVDTLASGVVFGFFATIAFIVDAALHFWQFWSKRRSANNGSTDNPAVTKVAENPGPSSSTMQNQPQQQVPPVQTLGAPPRYDALTNLPGQMPNTAGQMPNTAGQMPNTAGQMPNAAGQIPNAAGQTVPNPAGQTVVMYPPGQQYQTVSGQPAQMWQMA